MGQNPLQHRHPDAAQRLLRTAAATVLPARQRLPNLPGFPDRTRVLARAARTASRTLDLIDVSNRHGKTRMVEMNQQVLTNLERMVGEIENSEQESAAHAAG